MPNKSSGKERDRLLGERIIPVLPHSTIEGVHELRLSGNDTQRHTTANDFTIGCQISLDTVELLGTTGAGTETRNHFIKNE